MKKADIEKQAERITSLFSYRAGYSTPKEAYVDGALWVIAQIQDWIEERAKEPIPEHDAQCDFEDGFKRGLDAVDMFLDLEN